MIPSLTPAEIRTGERLRGIYTAAAEHILAEEQARDAQDVPTSGGLVAGRVAALLSTHEGRAEFTAYLDRLETTHGRDRAMRKFIDQHRAHLAQGGAT